MDSKKILLIILSIICFLLTIALVINFKPIIPLIFLIITIATLSIRKISKKNKIIIIMILILILLINLTVTFPTQKFQLNGYGNYSMECDCIGINKNFITFDAYYSECIGKTTNCNCYEGNYQSSRKEISCDCFNLNVFNKPRHWRSISSNLFTCEN